MFHQAAEDNNMFQTTDENFRVFQSKVSFERI